MLTPPPALDEPASADRHPASAQAALEQAVFSILNRFRAGHTHLCMTGGVANNSVLNGKIVGSRMFEDVHVPPVAGDAGTALGAALAGRSISVNQV